MFGFKSDSDWLDILKSAARSRYVWLAAGVVVGAVVF